MNAYLPVPPGLDPLDATWLSVKKWPFPSGRLHDGSLDLAVTDVGSGPTLLLVHVGLWSFLWRDVIADLSRDFRVVTFDAPGTGRSGRLAPKLLTLETAAQAVHTTIQQLNLRDLTLVVHDLGGPAGLAGVASVAERVAALVAISTFGWRPAGAVFRGTLRFMGSAPVRELDAVTAFLPRLTATSYGVGRHLDQADREAFLRGADRDARRSFHRYMHDARAANPLYDDVERVLREKLSDRPLLTIFGEGQDPFGFQDQWQRLFPSADRVVVPKSHHFPMNDDPAAVAGAIRSFHRRRVVAKLVL
jgi:haloalkane dehalogenase